MSIPASVNFFIIASYSLMYSLRNESITSLNRVTFDFNVSLSTVLPSSVFISLISPSPNEFTISSLKSLTTFSLCFDLVYSFIPLQFSSLCNSKACSFS